MRVAACCGLSQVFGRCIAGEGMAGNMGYFKTLILMGVLGCATCVTFMVVSAPGGEHRHTYGRPGTYHRAAVG